MIEDLSHLGDASWDESPEGQKAANDAIEASRQLAQQREEEDDTIERQVDEATGERRRAEERQKIAEEDANKTTDQEQGEEQW